MPQAHPYQTYQNTNVNTADQRQLIVMLYDGVIRFLRKSVVKMETGDVEGAHNYLVRSREIVSELLSTLRPEKAGEVGENLRRLYVFCFNRIVEANLYKDPAMVEEVVRILTTLRDGWANVKPQAAEGQPAEAERRKVSLTT